jgi:hypothetical protein
MKEELCAYCGERFTPIATYPPKKYCSSVCRRRESNRVKSLQRSAERAQAREAMAKLPKVNRGKQFQIHGDDAPVVLRSEVKYSNDKFTDEGLMVELEKIGAALGEKRWRKGSPGWLRERNAA